MPDLWRVLLVGCGELGSRHLQAVAAMPRVAAIDVVDPRPESLDLGRARLDEVPDRKRGVEIRWHASLDDASPGDLCIVATQAEGRCRLVREVADRLGYRKFLLEKVVSQSIAEMEELIAYARAGGVSAWVNCKCRAYPFHQRVKRLLDPRDPIVLSVMGGNHGLANNGVHAADLFAFYDGAEAIACTGAVIDPVLHSSKRGRDVFDLSGTLIGSTAKGSRFTLTYTGDPSGIELFSLMTPRYRFVVDHIQRWAVESDAASGWSWRAVPFTGELLVSQMTRRFALQMLSSQPCELPTLEESLVAHRFILDALQPHFRHLLEQDVELCPVT